MRRAFEGFPPVFWRLFAAVLVNRLGGFVVPFLALFLGGQRGLAPSTAGAVVACFGAGAIVGGPIGGALADRIGRRRSIALGMTLSAISMLVLAFTSGTAPLAAACLFLGIATELPRPAMNALVADLVPAEDRTRAYSAIYWAANLGFACAALLAGVASTAAFALLFVVDAVTCLATAALVWLTIPDVRVEGAEGARSVGLRELVTPFRDRRFVRFFVAMIAVAFVFFQFHVAMPLDLRARGVSTATYGVLVALNGVLVLVLQPLIAPHLPRLRRGVALAAACLLTGAGFGALGYVSTVAGYAAAIAVLTLGEVTMAPVCPAVVADLAPARLRGTYQGAHQLSYSVASCGAPLVGGAVLEAHGGPVLWTGCVAVAVAAAALHLANEPRRSPLGAPTPDSAC